MSVPFIDLEPYIDRVGGYDESSGLYGFDVRELLFNREFIGGGPTTQRLEAALATKLGVPHVVTCANGTDALVLALRANGIERGSRVAIPNLTFWATYEAVLQVGATPVVLDISPDDLQLSFEEFIRHHNRRQFDAVVLVHLYGWCSANLAKFRETCRERRIVMVEDGAQAFGVKMNGRSVFADADVATLSFHPAKVLGGIGDGGAVVCSTERVANRVRLLANHGRIGHYQHVAPGWNSRMDTVQAAWLLRALDASDGVIENRRRAHRACGYADWTPAGVTGNGYLDVSLSNDRDDERTRLAALGVATGCVYPTTIIDQDGAYGTISLGSLAVSVDAAKKVYNRPLFYGMTEEQIAHVRGASGG